MDKQLQARRRRSGLTSLLTGVLALVVAAAIVAGGLFVAAFRLGPVSDSQPAPVAQKIGPALAVREAEARARPARAVQVETQAMVEAATAANVPSPAPLIVEVTRSADAAPVLNTAAEAAATAGERAKPGTLGCTRYKTYDAISQTYRSYDGRVRECKP